MSKRPSLDQLRFDVCFALEQLSRAPVDGAAAIALLDELQKNLDNVRAAMLDRVVAASPPAMLVLDSSHAPLPGATQWAGLPQ